jgi:hypothetical protein
MPVSSYKYGLKSDNQVKYLEWLLDPLQLVDGVTVSSKAEWARIHGVHATTPRNWERDSEFRRVWDRELSKRNVDPGRTQQVIDAMHEAAAGGDVQAAKLYLAYVERFQPPPEPEQHKDASELSDEELEELLMGAAADELARRVAAKVDDA